MLGDPRLPRTLWLATGVAWAASSLILLARPTYWDPRTILDWAAVIAYTVAWLLLAPSIVLVSRLAEARRAHFLGTAIALAAVVAGVANIIEDGLGVAGASEWYVYGILIATVLLVPLAYLFARERALRLTGFCLALFLGIGFAAAGIGGLIILVLFGALALRTEWFESRSAPSAPEPAG
jgi:hypothetical protein